MSADLSTVIDEAFATEQVPWLARLVEAPSHTLARDDVEAAFAILDETLGQELGLDLERHPDPEGRFADHRVYATAAARGEVRSLVLVGHIDTVFPRSTGFSRFTVEGDVMRGPGVIDMKGGLSVGVFALRALRRVLGAERFSALPLRFVVVSDEEVGSPSSAAVFTALAPRASGALVLEAARAGDAIITMRKGTGAFTVEAHGRAAHAGNAHARGQNAIHALCRLVPRIEALTDYGRGITLNVGLIEGGTSRNTVPAYARCELDLRVETAADARQVIEALEAMIAEPLPEALAEVQLTLTGGLQRPPMEATAESQALRARYEAVAVKVGLGSGEAPRQGGGSDANLLAALGVPCIDGLGPWGTGFHSLDEHGSLDSLRRHTQALAHLLATFAG